MNEHLTKKPDPTIHDQIKRFLIYFAIVTFSVALLSNLLPNFRSSSAVPTKVKPKPVEISPEVITKGPCYSIDSYVSRGCR